jgi:hypothetical protein
MLAMASFTLKSPCWMCDAGRDGRGSGRTADRGAGIGYSQTSSLRARYSVLLLLLLFEPRNDLKSTVTRNETLAPTSADNTIGVVIVEPPFPVSTTTLDCRP